MSYLAKCTSPFLAGALLLFAAESAKANAVRAPAPLYRGSAGLTFLSFPLDSTAEAARPVRSPRSNELQHAHGAHLPEAAYIPPVLVKNPFLPAAQ
jgi:hypothetical protein